MMEEMYNPPCPDRNETCTKCDSRPGQSCLDPDVIAKVSEGNIQKKGFHGVPPKYFHGIPHTSHEKETNPKDSVGIRKVPVSTIPAPVLAEIGVAMMEGARKYGRHNYRVSGVQSSVYFDAAARHLFQWWEGEDIDPDSGLSHVTKAIASLTVLRDAMINNNINDDRPPKAPDGWLRKLNNNVEELFNKYPIPAPAHTELQSLHINQRKE